MMAEFPFRCLIKKILDGDFPGKQVDWGAWGPRDGMKRVRECVHGAELDLQTLVWTRGTVFPLARLEMVGAEGIEPSTSLV
jgi:hypothetical protein